MTMKPWAAALVATGALTLLAACDKSNQHADGTTAAGDPGTAASTGNGTIADTGGNTAAGDAAAAGQTGATPGDATGTTTTPPAVQSTGEPSPH